MDQTGNTVDWQALFTASRGFLFTQKNNSSYVSLVAVPEPVAFHPLNAGFKAAEKEYRQPKGILGDVAITNGHYNEPGGAYMFYGTTSSYIEFRNDGVLDTRFSITLMCWVQHEGINGPLFRYGYHPETGVGMLIARGKLTNEMVKRSFQSLGFLTTPEVLPKGKWVHVAASYDHNTGNNSLFINGHFSISRNIGKGYEIETTSQRVLMGTRGDKGWRFKGKIAEMKVYDVALNEEQIQTSIRQGS